MNQFKHDDGTVNTDIQISEYVGDILCSSRPGKKLMVNWGVLGMFPYFAIFRLSQFSPAVFILGEVRTWAGDGNDERFALLKKNNDRGKGEASYQAENYWYLES